MSVKLSASGRKRAVTAVLFVIYAALMLWLLIFRRIGRETSLSYGEYLSASVNLIPFRTVVEFIGHIAEKTRYAELGVRNLVGNIVLFIPLGGFLSLLWKKQRRAMVTALTVTAVILAVELIQLFAMLGSFDIDDIIFNVAGAMLGFALVKKFITEEE